MANFIRDFKTNFSIRLAVQSTFTHFSSIPAFQYSNKLLFNTLFFAVKDNRIL